MLFGNDRQNLRRFFQQTWNKALAGAPLQPLESIVTQVIRQHPEYHALLQTEAALERDWSPDQGQTNPFLHMGMHIAIAEQLGADQPPGIRQLYADLVGRTGDVHETEHRMLECLGRQLWEAQRQGTAPDQQAYLECLRALLG